MPAETVTVELGARSYPVRIGPGLRREVIAIAAARVAAGQKCATITSPGVAAALPELTQELAKFMPVLITVQDGETAKSAAELARVWDFLAGNGIARDGAVFALGGGVIGDLTGFAAASYQRGVDFYQIPTTLLAMVDSSVGGKTGINLAAGKNLVGNFHQPAVEGVVVVGAAVAAFGFKIIQVAHGNGGFGQRDFFGSEPEAALFVNAVNKSVLAVADAALNSVMEIGEPDKPERFAHGFLNVFCRC